MANYSIKFSCGHTESKQLYGPHAERERYMTWAGRQGDCSACYKAGKLAATETTEIALQMPELTGSEKQVAWARSLRSARLKQLTDRGLTEDFRPLMHGWLVGKTEAKWWIDHRDLTEVDVARMAAIDLGYVK